MEDRLTNGQELWFQAMPPLSPPWDAAGSARHGILLYGHDSLLLETRCWVLEKAGFDVWTATELYEVKEIVLTRHIELFILCQSVSTEERQGWLFACDTVRPKMKTLVLGGDGYMYLTGGQDGFMSPFQDPEDLIAGVTAILGPAMHFEDHSIRAGRPVLVAARKKAN
jgi:hypothetical protein